MPVYRQNESCDTVPIYVCAVVLDSSQLVAVWRRAAGDSLLGADRP